MILIHTLIYVERLRVPTPLFVLIIRVHNNHQLLYTNVQWVSIIRYLLSVFCTSTSVAYSYYWYLLYDVLLAVLLFTALSSCFPPFD